MNFMFGKVDKQELHYSSKKCKFDAYDKFGL